MKMFTVHYRAGTGGAPHEISQGKSRGADLVLVKEGFCGPAFFFGFLWPLAHRMWAVAAFFLIAQFLAVVAPEILGLGAVAAAVAVITCAVILGYLANDLRRNALRRAGYRDQAVVLGRTVAGGFRRYLDHAPHDVLLALAQ